MRSPRRAAPRPTTFTSSSRAFPRRTGERPGSSLSEGDSRVFLITGASSGIGEATARQAVAAGCRVVLAARSIEKLEALAAELDGLAVACDVTDWEQQDAMVERTLA